MSSPKEENSYRNILKGTSFLGGVQMFQVLVNLVRGKFVAIFLGLQGMGIATLFSTSSGMIQRVAQLGINLAVTKEVAARKDNHGALAEIVKVTTVVARFTAILGALFCILFSGWLSEITFGDSSYRWQFMLLAVMIFFAIDGAGKLSQLQGLHEVKRISMASMAGAATGLGVGVPLYWWLGNHGIVPAMCALSVVTWSCYTYSLRRSLKGISTVKFRWSIHGKLAGRLVSLGLLLMAGDLIGACAQYLLSIYLRSNGGLDTVGLFQAANSLTNQYSGMIFAAMSADYFPRLAALAADRVGMKKVVDRQVEIVGLIIAPVVILLLLTSPLVVKILLTDKFLPVTPLVRLIAVGVMFQALSYPLGYTFIAKNDKKLFFWLEGVSINILFLSMAILGYKLYGLNGLGYGMIAEQVITLLIYLGINRLKYGYRPSVGAVRETISGLVPVMIVFFLMFSGNDAASIITAWGVSIISIGYSAMRLRKLMSRKE